MPSSPEYKIFRQALHEHLEKRFPGRLARWEKSRITEGVLDFYKEILVEDGHGLLPTLTTAANQEALKVIGGHDLRKMLNAAETIDEADRRFVRMVLGEHACPDTVHKALKILYDNSSVDHQRVEYFVIVTEYLDLAHFWSKGHQGSGNGRALPCPSDVVNKLRSRGRLVTAEQATNAIQEFKEILEKLNCEHS